jgi:apolipoprotein N-acyltransferase
VDLKLSFNHRLLLACFAGGLAPFSFSPVNLWILGILSVSVLYGLLQNISSRQAAWLGWAFGVGFFGVGISWIYVSIKVYGNVSALIAGALIGLFVAALALLFSLQCWIYQRFGNRTYPALCFAGLWVLFEWLRAWFLTGFPWLYLGYAHIDTVLAGVAPIFGVFGISFIVVLTGCNFLQQYNAYRNTGDFFKNRQLNVSLLCLWLIPMGLNTLNWVEALPDQSISVSLVQANIDQDLKFNNSSLQEILAAYETLSEPLWEGDLVVWPETAIPLLYQQAGDLLENYAEKAREYNSTLVTGIFFQEDDRTFNSITSLGNGEGIYHKQKMVPFGEYQPFESILAAVFQLFDLPMSTLKRGPSNQPMLKASNLSLAPYICYEVVFPDFVRKNSINADFLLTISNDTWFGASFGPLQHLQMAAMRALENGKYMVRATNNGVSAIINEKGQILSRTEQFEVAVLTDEVKIFSGRTPFSRWGSYPIIFFSGLLFGLGLLKKRSAL